MMKRVVQGVAVLLLACGVAGCGLAGKSASDAAQGDCLDGGGMMADLNEIKVVPCDSSDAKYLVSAILGPNQKENCPKDGMFTYSWQANDKTICIQRVKS